MKKLIQTVLLILLVTTYVNAQSTERFIRIIGNSKTEIKSDKVRVYFTISEIVKNEYKKIESKSYDKVYREFLTNLSKTNFTEKDLNRSYNKLNRYNLVKSKKFFIDTDRNSLDILTNIKVAGFNVSDIKFLYAEIDDSIETKLSLEAIEDARRKAKKICDEIGMKLGKILNIEVKSANFERNESKESSKIETYKVSITFKLID